MFAIKEFCTNSLSTSFLFYSRRLGMQRSIIIACLHSNTSHLRGSVFCRRWPFLSLSGVTALCPRVHRLFDVSEVRFPGNSQNQRLWGGNLLEYVLLKAIPPKKYQVVWLYISRESSKPYIQIKITKVKTK